MTTAAASYVTGHAELPDRCYRCGEPQFSANQIHQYNKCQGWQIASNKCFHSFWAWLTIAAVSDVTGHAQLPDSYKTGATDVVNYSSMLLHQPDPQLKLPSWRNKSIYAISV